MHAKSGWKLKQTAVAFLLAFTTIASSVSAAPNAAAESNSAAAATSSEAAGNSSTNNGSAAASKAETPANASSPITESQFEELRGLIEAQGEQLKAQQETILALEAALHPTTAAEPTAVAAAAAEPVAVGADPQAGQDQTSQSPTVRAQVPQDWSTRVGNLENSLKIVGPFSFSGDIRLRGEPFFGGPANQSLDQARERFRLRFNVNAKLNDDIAGGFTLASGDINDPTSTNQTITGFYARKAIAIDKAFVDYTPHQIKSLTLIGGKFSYPWYNTELTWDKDINPEGLAQTLAFNINTPVLKKIALVGFELPFAQVAGVSLNNQSVTESIVYGGQLQTNWQFAPWLKFGAYTGFYNYHNADPIAIALAKASSKNPQTPLTGALPLGTGNTVQNSIVTTTATNVVTVAGVANPTGVSTVTNAQFNSKFGLFDSLARFDVKTPFDKWPVALIGDYVQNTEACANVDHITAKPVNTASILYTQTTNFACNANQRRGYWAEAQVGRAQKRGDLQFDYARIYIEREAVLSNFDYSDIRQGSNVTEHRAMAIYQAASNVQLSVTALIGRPLHSTESWLERYQFDVIYTF